jgi:hypothetical protein
MSLLVENNFGPECICPDFDWNHANKKVLEGFRGRLTKVPKLDELKEIIEEARTAGTKAAKRLCLDRLGAEEPPSDKYFLPCGSAQIILDVDGTSRLGRFLLKSSAQLKRASIEKDYKTPRRGLLLQIYDMHSRQELAIDEAAAEMGSNVSGKG